MITTNKKWGLRYLKLRISRKLAFAGALVALFWPTLEGSSTTVDALAEQFAIPSLGRLAQLGGILEGANRQALLEIFQIADEFALYLSQKETRAEAAAIDHPDDADPGSAFGAMRTRSVRLQELLEVVFFAEGDVGRLTKKYLTF